MPIHILILAYNKVSYTEISKLFDLVLFKIKANLIQDSNVFAVDFFSLPELYIKNSRDMPFT